MSIQVSTTSKGETEKVRPIVHATERSEDADRLLKQNGTGQLVFAQFQSDWPNSRFALEYPDLNFSLNECRLEVHVARRRGEDDRVSVAIKFPDDFPLASTQYALDLNSRKIAGSDKRVLGDGQINTLRFFAGRAI